jgi:hypothetical protein
MASNLLGKYGDMLITLKKDQHIFIKCLSAKERNVLGASICYYAKKFKRKYKTTLIEKQLKVTRVL